MICCALAILIASVAALWARAKKRIVLFVALAAGAVAVAHGASARNEHAEASAALDAFFAAPICGSGDAIFQQRRTSDV